MQDIGKKPDSGRRKTQPRNPRCGAMSGRASQTRTDGRTRAPRNDAKTTKRPLRTTREMTLEIAAKEYVWLWDRRHGMQHRGDRRYVRA